MQQTEQLLQEAIDLHQTGELQEAEKLYLDILLLEPEHGNANHNLGTLCMQKQQPNAALKYFSVALGADSTRGQYWLSYIDALVQDGQLEVARQILALAQHQGLHGQDVDALDMSLNGGKRLTEHPSAEVQPAVEASRPISSISKIYCISHQPPLLPERLYDYAIGLGDYFPERGANISAIDTFWHANRSISYGAAGSYSLPRAVKANGDQTDMTGVCSNRKIVLRNSIGRKASNYAGMRIVTEAELALLSIDETRPNEGLNFLLPAAILFPEGIVAQYSTAHHIIDLLDYLSIAVQFGVISPPEVNKFIAEQVLIPGGCECGVYPTKWLTETLLKLEIIGREFITQHGDRISQYDSYQVRAVGFLSERLGSFLLLKELAGRYPTKVPKEIFGFMCTVVQDENVDYSGTCVNRQ